MSVRQPNPGYVKESAVINAPLEAIWSMIAPMTFKFCSNIAQSKKNEDDSSTLGQYTIAYTDNTVQTVRMTSMSEGHSDKRSVGFELVQSEPAVSYTSVMHLITLTAVTHTQGGPQTFVEYSSDFSTDADTEAIQDSKYKKIEFFQDLQKAVA
uniref:Bet v I/Major latex protein domain-containing protein n=1 Tax=Oxyrrhis marina TaxID=2969 RepID=A0A7S3UM32_OXYMA